MKFKLLIAVLGLQAAWIGGTSLYTEHELATGQTIRLETARVDPRDFLRGNYLILNYKISTVPLTLFPVGERAALTAGTHVYVGLEAQGEFFATERASIRPLEPQPGEVILKGEVTWGPLQNSYRVTYGMEKYYVRESAAQPKGKLTAEVCVPRSGRGLVTRLFEDGSPYQTE